jgi:ribose transport system permease protein
MTRAATLSLPGRILAPPSRARDLYKASLLPVLLIVLMAALAVAEPKFLSETNLSNVLRTTSYLAIISCAQMLVMILGGIDLSVGVVAALASVLTAMSMARYGALFPGSEALTIGLALATSLAAATLVGVVNGVCVAYSKASAFMVTLGTFCIVGGVAYYLTAGIPIYGMPQSFVKGFGRGSFAGVPYSVYIAVAVVAALWFGQRYLRAGRYHYAVGGNEAAARAAGLPVSRVVVGSYALSSFLAGLTGILITARIGSGQANLGSEYMLQSVGAAVIAGVSLRGGVGRAEMIAVSSLLLAVIANGMNLIRIDSKLQTIVFGLVLLGAVALDQLQRREGRDE